MFKGRSMEEIQERLDKAVANIVEKKVSQMKKKRGKFVGRSTLLKEKLIVVKAKKEEPIRAPIPKVAAETEESRRAWREARREWLVAYQAAREEWLKGNREIEFPSGTWHMYHAHGAKRASG